MVRTHPSKVAICIIEKEEKKNWMFPIKNYQNKNKIIIIKKKVFPLSQQVEAKINTNKYNILEVNEKTNTSKKKF